MRFSILVFSNHIMIGLWRWVYLMYITSSLWLRLLKALCGQWNVLSKLLIVITSSVCLCYDRKMTRGSCMPSSNMTAQKPLLNLRLFNPLSVVDVGLSNHNNNFYTYIHFYVIYLCVYTCCLHVVYCLCARKCYTGSVHVVWGPPYSSWG
jgi:hypothetical protein